jgi:hypothetical protein
VKHVAENMKTRQQLNTLVPNWTKRAVVTVAKKSPFDQGEIVEVAVALLFGNTDEWLIAKQRKIAEIIKSEGIKFDPFEVPLAA